MLINNQQLKEFEKQSIESERQILVIAKIKAQKSVSNDPSVSNLIALEKATKMLSVYDAEVAGPVEPTFANRIEALEWLNRQGYKIAKSKLYADCKKGLLKLQDDGSVFESDLKRYTRKVTLNKLSETPDAAPGDFIVQKASAEIEKLRTQNKLLQIQLDEKLHKYITRADFEIEFAARVSVLKFGIEHMIYSYAFEWKELVLTGDKVSATQRLIDNMIHVVKKQFNDFANIKKFEVVFAKEELTEDFITESIEK